MIKKKGGLLELLIRQPRFVYDVWIIDGGRHYSYGNWKWCFVTRVTQQARKDKLIIPKYYWFVKKEWDKDCIILAWPGLNILLWFMYELRDMYYNFIIMLIETGFIIEKYGEGSKLTWNNLKFRWDYWNSPRRLF